MYMILQSLQDAKSPAASGRPGRPTIPSPVILFYEQASSVKGSPAVNPKRVLLIVGGGVAAYKALELVRLFRKAGVRTRSQLVRIAIEKHSSDWLQTEHAEPAARS